MKLFESAQARFDASPYLTGFAVGALVQQLTLPLFKINLANHNYTLGDRESYREFWAAIRGGSREGRVQFMLKAPLALLVRGGMFGTIQLGFFKELLHYVDRNNVASPTDPGHHSVRVREFIDSVEDGNELLHRLAYSGYFD